MAKVTANSTLPPQAAFHHAILRHLARHPDGDRRHNIHEAMPDLLGLSEAQRTERLANLAHLRYRHRSGWGLSMLKAAGYVDSPASGIWRITDRGRDLLVRHPDGFDEETARWVIRAGRREIQKEDVADDRRSDTTEDLAQQTPDERIDNALNEIHRAVAQELLDKITQAPPVFFEDLVLDLLHALGYGASEEGSLHHHIEFHPRGAGVRKPGCREHRADRWITTHFIDDRARCGRDSLPDSPSAQNRRRLFR